jgi:hypothetical protein
MSHRLLQDGGEVIETERTGSFLEEFCWQKVKRKFLLAEKNKP